MIVCYIHYTSGVCSSMYRRLADRLAVVGDDRASYAVKQSMQQKGARKKPRGLCCMYREQVFGYGVVKEEFYMDIRDLVREDYAYTDGGR